MVRFKLSGQSNINLIGAGTKLLFFSKYVFNLSQKSLFNNKTTQQGGWGDRLLSWKRFFKRVLDIFELLQAKNSRF